MFTFSKLRFDFFFFLDTRIQDIFLRDTIWSFSFVINRDAKSMCDAIDIFSFHENKLDRIKKIFSFRVCGAES